MSKKGSSLRPLGDNLVVKTKSETETHASGIIIPPTAKEEKPTRGEVIAVGPGKMDENGKRIPMDVKVGDTVIFTQYSPHEIKVGDEEYLVVSQDSVLAVVEE